MNKKIDQDMLTEKILRANFKSRPPVEIPGSWRAELMEKITEPEFQTVNYEERLWRLAWISFAASVVLFLGLLLYSLNKHDYPLKHVISQQIYEYLSVEYQLKS
jgi:hypothetical protein